jgi:hypothetical protein
MSPAPHLDHGAVSEQGVVPGVCIGLQVALVASQKVLDVLPFVRAGSVEHHPAAQRVQVRPHPALDAPALVRLQHHDRRVVGLHVVGGQHLAAQLFRDRLERLCRCLYQVA